MKIVKSFVITSLIVLCVTTSCWAESEYVTALRNGNTDEARELFWKDLKTSTNPDFLFGDAGKKLALAIKRMMFHTLLAEAYDAEQYDFAIEMSNEALEREQLPEVQSAILSGRGRFWTRRGEYEKATADYAKSVEVLSDTNSLLASAWFLATCPDAQYRDGKKAVEYAEKGIGLAEDEYRWNYERLAAAYAENGDFENAITAQEKAIELLIASQEELLAKIEDDAKKETLKKEQAEDRAKDEERLVLYKSEKPYREDLSQ